MHMADALISPAVGAAFSAAAIGLGAWSVHRLRQEQSEERTPLMGVMGAFVFTAQMVNFAIPGTGSSGHLGGGLLLAAVLGPHAAFLTIAAILTVQALLFGDGGLLALGCNIINLGFFPCFVAWPLFFKPLLKGRPSRRRTAAGSLLGAIAGLQAGAFSVVMQTLLSGRADLPFTAFLLLMQPIHLAIGIVEGLVTAAVVLFMVQHRPETLLGMTAGNRATHGLRHRSAVTMLALTVLTGVLLSSFASSAPDGLEWSLLHAAGTKGPQAQSAFHEWSASLQKTTALLPDYGFKTPSAGSLLGIISPDAAFSGLIGGSATLLVLSGTAAVLIRKRKTQPTIGRREPL